MQKSNHFETPEQTASCRYHRHLKGAHLSVYEYALALCKAAKASDLLFYASVATTSDETGYSRDTVRQALADLSRAGWLIPLGGNRDAAKQGGAFQPNTYRIIEHDQWTTLHLGKCDRASHNGKIPSRENVATEETREPVTGKPRRKVVLQVEPEVVAAKEEIWRKYCQPRIADLSWEELFDEFHFDPEDEYRYEALWDWDADVFNVLVRLSDESGTLEWQPGRIVKELHWGDVTNEGVEDALEDILAVGLAEVTGDGDSRRICVSCIPGWDAYRRILIGMHEEDTERRKAVRKENANDGGSNE